jgi:hypothetical protein
LSLCKVCTYFEYPDFVVWPEWTNLSIRAKFIPM